MVSNFSWRHQGYLGGRCIAAIHPQLIQKNTTGSHCIMSFCLMYKLNWRKDLLTIRLSRSITVGLLHLLPTECLKVSDDVMVPDDLAKAVEIFKGNLPHAVMFNIEYDSWVRQWKDSPPTNVPDTLGAALRECHVMTYPNVNLLLTLALTLPITDTSYYILWQFQPTKTYQDSPTCYHVGIEIEFTCFNEDQSWPMQPAFVCRKYEKTSSISYTQGEWNETPFYATWWLNLCVFLNTLSSCILIYSPSHTYLTSWSYFHCTGVIAIARHNLTSTTYQGRMNSYALLLRY